MSFWSQRRDDPPSPTRSTPPAPTKAEPSRMSAPRPSSPERNAAPANSTTLIASGSTFVGEISGNTELLIHGIVKGHIDLDSRVIVGAEGKVEGDIRAVAIEIAGKVHGNVHCDGLLKVHSSGSLEGEVVAVEMDVDKGCFLSGRVQRIKPGDVAARKAPAKSDSKMPATDKAGASSAAASSDAAGTDAAGSDAAGAAKPAPVAANSGDSSRGGGSQASQPKESPRSDGGRGDQKNRHPGSKSSPAGKR